MHLKYTHVNTPYMRPICDCIILHFQVDITEPKESNEIIPPGDRFVATRGRGGALKTNGAPLSRKTRPE